MLSGPQQDLVRRFLAIDDFLRRHEDLWRPRPFIGEATLWEASHPALSIWVRAMDQDALERWEVHPHRAPDAPPLLRQLADESSRLCGLPRFPRAADHPALHPTPEGIPTRKWRQVEAFTLTALPLLEDAAAVIDWCAGKSHLGRTIGRVTGLPVQAIERDQALVATGRGLAHRDGAHLEYTPLDVHSRMPSVAAPRDTVLAALHACGDLTDHALDFCLEQGLRRFLISPCCYHAIQAQQLNPRSMPGKASALRLQRHLLRLPSAEETFTTTRGRRLRRTELVYRTALDQLRRQSHGSGGYRPLRSVPRSWLTGGLAHFMDRVAVRDDLVLPRHPDLVALERSARLSVHRSRCLGVVRAPFRRPLELWVNLDRAIHMQEHGWTVHMGTLCPRSVTPRNLLLAGERSPGAS